MKFVPDYYTTKEAARILGKEPQDVSALVNRKVIKSLGHGKVCRKSVDEYSKQLLTGVKKEKVNHDNIKYDNVINSDLTKITYVDASKELKCDIEFIVYLVACEYIKSTDFGILDKNSFVYWKHITSDEKMRNIKNDYKEYNKNNEHKITVNCNNEKVLKKDLSAPTKPMSVDNDKIIDTTDDIEIDLSHIELHESIKGISVKEADDNTYDISINIDNIKSIPQLLVLLTNALTNT